MRFRIAAGEAPCNLVECGEPVSGVRVIIANTVHFHTLLGVPDSKYRT